jgi:hypothetical protein
MVFLSKRTCASTNADGNAKSRCRLRPTALETSELRFPWMRSPVHETQGPRYTELANKDMRLAQRSTVVVVADAVLM